MQSRYYNAGLGRFNAPDAFASTGQGILGNNMFAYCNNNPINNYDPDGAYTRGEIHNFVLAEIIKHMKALGRKDLHMHKTTIYYNGYNFLGGWGFCDLYDLGTGEVWELKRTTQSKTRAEKQLKNYISGRLAIAKGRELKVGGDLFEGKHEFVKTDDSGTYHITYWQGENGILWYDYTYVKSDQQRVATAMSIGGAGLGLACMIFGGLISKNSSSIKWQNAA